LSLTSHNIIITLYVHVFAVGFHRFFLRYFSGGKNKEEDGKDFTSVKLHGVCKMSAAPDDQMN